MLKTMDSVSGARALVAAALCGLLLAACGEGSASLQTEADDGIAAALRSGAPNVILQSAAVQPYGRGGANEFVGSILVKNIAFSKRVAIVYSTDGWASTRTLFANYQSAFEGGYEVWSFRYPAQVGARFEFAVSYSVAGQTFWDNNDAHNYVVSMTENNVPPICRLVYASALANGDVSVQVKVRDLAYEKSVKISYYLDYSHSSFAQATFASAITPGTQLWALDARFPTVSESPNPQYHVKATCSMVGIKFESETLYSAFPGSSGERQ